MLGFVDVTRRSQDRQRIVPLRYSNLVKLGWSPQRDDAFADEFNHDVDAPPIEPARVIRQDRGAWHVIAPTGRVTADLRGRVRAGAAALALPTVGDWVAISLRVDEQRASIEALLPRTSALLRHAAGDTTDAQVVAANVDAVLITIPANSPPNPRRLERQLAMTAQSGATAVIVVTKFDLVDNDAQQLSWIAAVAGVAPVVAMNAKEPEALSQLAPWLRPGTTLVLIGPSGAGKSTLANSLLGEQLLATGAVRQSDVRGRHTTTWRELVTLPGGAMLIDTPGTRELGLWDADEGLAETFADLQDLAQGCRFNNCGHSREPGCAIVAALAAHEVTTERVSSWQKLRAELSVREARQLERQRADERRGRPSRQPPTPTRNAKRP
jgi:ribosome biogenesis GTPase / thiamine phosphate phosphatase